MPSTGRLPEAHARFLPRASSGEDGRDPAGISPIPLGALLVPVGSFRCLFILRPCGACMLVHMGASRRCGYTSLVVHMGTCWCLLVMPVGASVWQTLFVLFCRALCRDKRRSPSVIPPCGGGGAAAVPRAQGGRRGGGGCPPPSPGPCPPPLHLRQSSIFLLT